MGACEGCGCDPVSHARLVRKWTEAERLYKKEAANHAITKAQFQLYQLEKQGDESWAQAKVRRQAAMIQRQNEAYRDAIARHGEAGA